MEKTGAEAGGRGKEEEWDRRSGSGRRTEGGKGDVEMDREGQGRGTSRGMGSGIWRGEGPREVDRWGKGRGTGFLPLPILFFPSFTLSPSPPPLIPKPAPCSILILE